MSTYKQSGWSERAGNRFPGGSSGGGKESDGGHHENHGGIRVHGQKGTGFRHRRFGRNWKACVFKGFRFVFPAVALLMVMVFVFFFLDTREDLSLNEKSAYDPLDFFSNSSDTNTPFKKLNFGRGSGSIGRDSRYWDRDDRRRDSDYDEDALTHLVNDIASVVSNQQGAKITKRRGLDDSSRREFDISGTHSILPEGSHGGSSKKIHHIPKNNYLYNEYGRKELRHYEAEYEASLNGSNHSDENSANRSTHSTNKAVANQGQAYYEKREAGFDTDPFDFDDEYDDGVDMQENHGEFAMDSDRKSTNFGVTTASTNGDLDMENNSNLFSEKADGSSSKPRIVGGVKGDSSRRTNSAIKSSSKRKGKRRKFAGPPCGMKLLDSSALSVEPIENKKFARFSLQYTEFEGVPFGQQNWKPRFAGHQTLEEREQSFYAQNKKIHGGFVKAPKGLPGTGFDLAENDLKFMSSCHIAVSSCIFGNSDNLRTPMQSVVSRLSRKTVCFVMFVDEDTLQTLSSEGQKPDPAGYIGFWRIVVVRNLPYPDMRRVGKIPKFLAHRIFRSARYSIWLDSKLRLQSDPLLLLEYFLWRKGYEYAISNHYDRHCVWEEVVQNKKLNKFNHTVIDEQFMFYQADGLKRFNVSDPNKLLPSYVPEGSFIIRAHTPMSNLFSCLWFNEVDRFTPRDQLSFAYTYLKLRRMNPEKPFYLNMFKDCERRSIAKLFHHRAEEKRNLPLEAKE